MVIKLVVADEAIKDEIDRLVNSPHSKPFSAGLVVGQRSGPSSNGREIIAHLAPTPSGEEEEGENEDSGPQNVEDLDVPWMLEHYLQVDKMLSGGLDVIGAFVVNSTDIFDSNVGMTHLRKLCKSLAIQQNEVGKEFLILHVNRSNGKVTARLVDTSPTAGQNLKNVDLKIEDTKMLKVEGDLLLDVPLVFDEQETQHQLSDKIEKAMKSFEKVIENSIILFDNAFRVDTHCLDPEQEALKAAKGKKGQKGAKAQRQELEDSLDDEDADDMQTFEVQVLLQDDPGFPPKPEEGVEDLILTDIHSRMKFSGRMKICCFLHRQATVGEAMAAVKKDILRTMRGRIMMHCDSLVGEEQKGTEEDGETVMHEPPRRILVQLPYSRASISDYLFPGETPYDQNNSVEEIFGFRPRIEWMNDDIELVAAPKETMASESENESRAPSPSSESQLSPSKFSTAILSLAIVMGLSALGLAYYFYFEQSDDDNDARGTGGDKQEL